MLLVAWEYGELEEQVLVLRREFHPAQAELNRLAGRDSRTPINVPKRLSVSLPEWSHTTLRQIACQHRPAIAAAQIRAPANRWGLEFVRLKRCPELALNTSWFASDDNRSTTNIC